jgi:hypothetical protein
VSYDGVPGTTSVYPLNTLKEGSMYIGIGTLLVILIIVIIVL